MLEDIEDYQNQTDNLLQNIGDIDALLLAGETAETKEQPLTKAALKRQRLFTYARGRKEDEVCSVCLQTLQRTDRVYELVC
jgi:hypothetical protein